MNTGNNFDQLLDVKGFNCPMPILKTKKAMESLRGAAQKNPLS